MRIGEIRSFGILPNAGVDENKIEENNPFTDVFQGFVKDVNQSQMDSKNITEEFLNGGNVEIQEVMVAGEKAKTSLELLMEIRNKAIDMYRELTRMQ